jgi:hypothetical protein
MYRVQIPSVTSFGWRSRSLSVDGKERFYSCSCGSVPSPSLFHRAAKMEEGTCLLTQSGVKVGLLEDVNAFGLAVVKLMMAVL